MKIRQVVAEFFLAVGRTDKQTHITKVIVAFHNFANAPEIQSSDDMIILKWVIGYFLYHEGPCSSLSSKPT